MKIFIKSWEESIIYLEDDEKEIDEFTMEVDVNANFVKKIKRVMAEFREIQDFLEQKMFEKMSCK